MLATVQPQVVPPPVYNVPPALSQIVCGRHSEKDGYNLQFKLEARIYISSLDPMGDMLNPMFCTVPICHVSPPAGAVMVTEDVDATGAEQLTVVATLGPTHDQVQGPEPETAEAVPAEQRLAVGAELTATPLAVPQTPAVVGATMLKFAEEPPTAFNAEVYTSITLII